MEKEVKFEDMGVVVESKDAVFWKKVIEETKHEIEKCNSILKFQSACLEMAEQKLAQCN